MIPPPTMENIKKMKWLAGNGSKEQGFSMYTENKENGSELVIRLSLLKGILSLVAQSLSENEQFLKEVLPKQVFFLLSAFLFKRLDMTLELDGQLH